MLRERVVDLENELAKLRMRVIELENEPLQAVPAPATDPAPRVVVARPRPMRLPPAKVVEPAASARTLEDFLGGRLLAWTGGVAICAGLALLFTLAIAHGWITEGARTVIGAGFAATLLAGGMRLHGRHGRTHASLALAGTGIAGLFMATAVATSLYDLVPTAAGLAAAIIVGAFGTWLATRWAAEVIAWLGILGAIAAPLMTGVPIDATRTAFVAVALGAAAGVLVSKRWTQLALAAFSIAAVQWVPYLFEDGTPAPAILITLAVFGALHIAMGLGADIRERATKPSTASIALLSLNAAVLTAAGWQALIDAGSPGAARMLLAALAGVHLAAGVWGRHGRRLSDGLGVCCLALGAILTNLAFAAVTHGVVRGLGWTAGAAALAYIARRSAPRELEDTFLALGLGGHTTLALGQALVAAPPSHLASAPADAGGLLLLTAIAASCLISGQLLASRRAGWAMAANAAGLLTAGYLTAVSLDGLALTAAFAGEAVALAAVARRHDDPVARIASFTALAVAGLYTLVELADPADALTGGFTDGLTSMAALGILTGGLAAVRHRATGDERRQLTAATAVSGVYAISAAAVNWTLAGPAPLHLGEHQQGQLQLTAVWAVLGVSALIAGLRRDNRDVRLAGFGLLGLATGKAFLVDMANLTSGYRVTSLIGLGLLLLGGAFAYQRLRPEPLADLREVPDALR